jgi:hypothetical protein
LIKSNERVPYGAERAQWRTSHLRSSSSRQIRYVDLAYPQTRRSCLDQSLYWVARPAITKVKAQQSGSPGSAYWSAVEDHQAGSAPQLSGKGGVGQS